MQLYKGLKSSRFNTSFFGKVIRKSRYEITFSKNKQRKVKIHCFDEKLHKKVVYPLDKSHIILCHFDLWCNLEKSNTP